MTKVIIKNCAFLDGDDFDQFLQDKEDFETNFPDKIFDVYQYLLQYYYPSEVLEEKFDAEYINTPFLGYERNIPGIKGKFLFSYKPGLYIGLSEIIGYEEE